MLCRAMAVTFIESCVVNKYRICAAIQEYAWLRGKLGEARAKTTGLVFSNICVLQKQTWNWLKQEYSDLVSQNSRYTECQLE